MDARGLSGRSAAVWFDEAKYHAGARGVEPRAQLLAHASARRPRSRTTSRRVTCATTSPEEAVKARALLASYTEGSAWWNANLDHPLEQRRAEQLAEEAVVAAALYHHAQAQRLRRLGVKDQDPELIQQRAGAVPPRGQGLPRLHLRATRTTRRPTSSSTTWPTRCSGRRTTKKPAREYAAVRDSNLDDRFLSESARRVVESLKRLVDMAVEKRRAHHSHRAAARPRARRPRCGRCRCRRCCSAWRRPASSTWRASTRCTTPRRCAPRTPTTTPCCSISTATGRAP